MDVGLSPVLESPFVSLTRRRRSAMLTLCYRTSTILAVGWSVEKNQRELSFVLDPAGGVPFYRQIILQVEMAIADGRLKPGTQLPTVRGLAVQLQINPNTVARAYSELEIRGIVTTQQGTGTFISDQEVALSQAERDRVLMRLVQSFLATASGYGFSIGEITGFLRRIEEGQSHGESSSS